tara:strand:- start:362 stop:535 length:174 start_codon:yes stop_codon:yes gene_type:complete
MPIRLNQTSSPRKNIKLGRIKTTDKVFFSKNNPIAPDPDSIIMNRIIGNIKKNWGGK